MESKDSWEDKEDSWENKNVDDLAENLQQLSVDTKKQNNNKTTSSSSTYTPKSVKGRGELKYRRYEKEKAEEEYEASQNSEKSKSTDQTQDLLKSISHIDHILEMYDFPSNCTVLDLEKILLPYKSFGFRVELVDSTHALVSFNSPTIAKDALRTVKKGAKLRSIMDASSQSQQIVIKQKGMTSPSKQTAYDHEIAEWEGNGSVGRPATSDRVARRMIANALQMPELVKSPKSSEPQSTRQKTEKKDYWND